MRLNLFFAIDSSKCLHIITQKLCLFEIFQFILVIWLKVLILMLWSHVKEKQLEHQHSATLLILNGTLVPYFLSEGQRKRTL